MAANCFRADAPVTRNVRAYFAPVDRRLHSSAPFDPGEHGDFALDAPPAPWISLGWIDGFTRKSGSKIIPVMTGVPSAALEQIRTDLDAQVSFQFNTWTKLALALSAGSQQMNVLAAAPGASPQRTGALAVGAVAIQAGSTASAIVLNASDAASFAAGSMVAVDVDYTGQTGFVGTPVAGSYVRQPLSDVDYIRRVTLNVGLVSQVAGGVLTLAAPLPGGVPVAGAKVQGVSCFVDREGGAFFQEWSGLFVMEGSQGERILFHYPRLQTMAGTCEAGMPLAPKSSDLERMTLKAEFRALPVIDPLDGERVLCYRSFIPAARALV